MPLIRGGNRRIGSGMCNLVAVNADMTLTSGRGGRKGEQESEWREVEQLKETIVVEGIKGWCGQQCNRLLNEDGEEMQERCN